MVSGGNSGVSAQGGGGGNVAIYKDGEKASKAVRSINFKGNVEITKEGSNHVAVDILNGSLETLTDVTITSPITGQVVSYNGSEWVNINPVSTTTFNTKTGNIVLTGGNDITITESQSNIFDLAVSFLDGGSF